MMVEGGEMHQTAAVCLQAARKKLLIEEYSSCECYRRTESASVLISRSRKKTRPESGFVPTHASQGLKRQSQAVGIKRPKVG